MDATPDEKQPPQASASTNSAIRAMEQFLDGVSQEIRCESSVDRPGVWLPVLRIACEFSEVDVGNRIRGES
jgi:hypothetical protein